MDTITSLVRLVIATALTVLIVIFAMGNAHHVEMGLVFGKPLEIRLIFLLAIAYVAGVVTTAFFVAIRNVRQKVAAQALRNAIPMSAPVDESFAQAGRR